MARLVGRFLFAPCRPLGCTVLLKHLPQTFQLYLHVWFYLLVQIENEYWVVRVCPGEWPIQLRNSLCKTRNCPASAFTGQRPCGGLPKWLLAVLLRPRKRQCGVAQLHSHLWLGTSPFSEQSLTEWNGGCLRVRWKTKKMVTSLDRKFVVFDNPGVSPWRVRCISGLGREISFCFFCACFIHLPGSDVNWPYAFTSRAKSRIQHFKINDVVLMADYLLGPCAHFSVF